MHEADFPGPGYMLLAAVPLLCLLGGPFYPPLFLGIVFSFCVNLIVHYRAEVVWTRQINAVTHIATVLAAANRLSRSEAAAIAPEVQRMRALCAKLRGLRVFSRLCGETDDGRGDPRLVDSRVFKNRLSGQSCQPAPRRGGNCPPCEEVRRKSTPMWANWTHWWA